MPAIEVSHLTKEYRLGANQGLKQIMLNTGARLAGKKAAQRPQFKALDDVSFSIEQGEVVGIIGHNGAGKSTLLKLLAGISTPSSGTVTVTGRIAPLIEVGAGFVPDFTGRENVYLNGAILGMSRKEIDSKFDAIVDFAEMEQFIDTPVKRYSSGMQVKLAFSVATSIESEILVVDEVLAVGDLAFQRKCFDRMEELINQQGRTVLIVSHNIRQIERLCRRTLLLDHGKLNSDGPPSVVCDEFYALSNAAIAKSTATKSIGRARFESVPEFEMIGIDLLDGKGAKLDQIVTGSDLTIALHVRCEHAIGEITAGLGVHTTDFFYLTTHSSESYAQTFDLPAGESTLVCEIRHLPLLPGVYQLRVGISNRAGATILYGENLKQLRIVSPTDAPMPASMRDGMFLLDATWLADNSASLHGRSDAQPSSDERSAFQIESVSQA